MSIRFAPAVMSLFGTALAWRAFAEYGGWPQTLTSAVMIALLALGLLGLGSIVFHLMHRAAFIEAVAHPHTRILPAGLTIGLMLLAALIGPVLPSVGVTVLWLGSLLHIAFLLWLINGWFQGDVSLEQVSPGWFIPAVGNIVIPVGAMEYGQYALAWVGFSIGIMLWLALLPIVLLRLITVKPMPPELEASQMILVAPPAIGAVSWSLMMPEAYWLPGLILTLFAGFLWVALVPLVLRVLGRSFYPANWAFGFPMAALATALVKYGAILEQPVMTWAGGLVLVCVTSLVVWFLLGSARLIAKI